VIVAKRKKASRRRKKEFSLWDAGVALGNLTILTEGALGTSPLSFITGKQDLGTKTSSGWGDMVLSGSTSVVGADEISLADLLSEPALAYSQIAGNMRSNGMGMAVTAVGFNVGAKLLRRLLRQPINSSNRMIRQLGMGVKI